MFDSVLGGVVIICALALVAGILCARLRSPIAGLPITLVVPIVMSYALAWVEMSTTLHPHAEAPGGWVIVATIYWSAWGVPLCIVAYIAERWRRRHWKGNAL